MTELDSIEAKPKQMTLFELATDNKYSNAIVFYDLMPKYDYRKLRYLPINEENSSITRTWVHREDTYHVTIKPASIIRTIDGVEVKQFVFPSTREEIVEDAIRKLAASGHGALYEDTAACMFTLYGLKKELKRVGHTYSITEIKEAIQILSESNIKVTDEFGKSRINSPFFAASGLTTRKELDLNAEAKCFVYFNVLVSKSIKALEFRQINYEKQMHFRTSLARSIFKRLSNAWVQASITNAYGPVSIWTLFSNAGITPSSKMNDNRGMVERALLELKRLNIIDRWEEDLYGVDGKWIKESKKGMKITDVKYGLLAHRDFIKDQKRSNYFEKKLTQIKDKTINP